MLVERTTGVNRPLTCYRCQQGFTTSLEVDTYTPKHTILIMYHTHTCSTLNHEVTLDTICASPVVLSSFQNFSFSCHLEIRSNR